MKIGILTQPLLNNYGGVLQNYALQHVLKRLGHKVETVDWRPIVPSPFVMWLWRNKNTFMHFFDKSIEIPRYQLTNIEQAVVSQNTNYFIHHYIDVCPTLVRTPEMFNDVDRQFNYDCYVIGSDQCWRPCYNSMLQSMFLDFCKTRNVMRVAYAASFGSSQWEYSDEMTRSCSALAKLFDLITVREKSGVSLCREYLGVDSIHVLDPTLLLSKDDYEALVNKENEKKNKGTLFHYILDPSEQKKSLIELIALENGLKPFTVMPKCQVENRTRKDVKKHIEDCIFPSVTSWLRGFMDAKMVVVDSFHGAVFSIIFNKPFWVVNNPHRGSARFDSLLDLFGLSNRLITPENLSHFDWNQPINWEQVNSIKKDENQRCIELLTNVLNQGKIKICH